MNSTLKKGFTLVELLIVIGILAVLATTAVVILNPAQLLAQSRDGQRLSDMASLQSAIALYMTDVSPVDLGACNDGAGLVGRYSDAVTPAPSGSFASVGTTGTGTRAISGAGWVDIDFTDIDSGTPFSTLPIDPSNSGDFVYRYACEDASTTSGAKSPVFEINACLESDKYIPYMEDDSGDKNATSGACGTARYYEVGTALTL